LARQLAAVALGFDRLTGPGVPGTLVAGEDALVGKEDGGARGVEGPTGVDVRFERAGEAARVAHHEDVEGDAGAAEHLAPGGMCRDLPARVGDRPLDPGVDEPVALDGSGNLQALALGAEVVVLACGGLAYPGRRTQAR